MTRIIRPGKPRAPGIARAWFVLLLVIPAIASAQNGPARFRIQVYAATTVEDAHAVALRVHEALDRRYATYAGQRSKYHVVRVGDFSDARSAQPALRAIRALGYADAWIAKNDPMQASLTIRAGEPSATSSNVENGTADARAAETATEPVPAPEPSPSDTTESAVPGSAGEAESSALASAEDATSVRKQIRATHSAEAVRIDGLLDDPVWADAAFVSDFLQRGKIRGFPPRERTEVAIAFDDEALYVGARLAVKDSKQMRQLVSRHDEPGKEERLLISLDTYRDRQTAYTFGVTIGGARIDYLSARDNEGWQDDSYNPVWEAQTTVDSTGWFAEMRIPYSQLRFQSSAEPVWGINIRRWNPATFLNVYWVMIPVYETGWASRFGEIAGLQRVRGERRVEIVPYALAGTTMPDAQLTAEGAVRENARRGGADIKIGLAPNLTLAATINPDFGQIEADPAEVNLSAYETFFPEKRPFFLEARELFRSRGPFFFYSRRIGAVPPGTVPRGALDAPLNATILGAAKLTGRLASGLSIGAVTAVTASENASVSGQGGLPTTIPAAPPSAFTVVRLNKELGQGSNAGFILTGVERSFDESRGLGRILSRRAYAGAGDWNLRFGGGLYELSGHAGFSWVAGDTAAIRNIQMSSAHFLQRPDAEHVSFDPRRTALGGYTAGLTLSKFAGANWFWDAEVSAQSPGFEIRDAGSQKTADIIDANLGLSYHQRGRRGLIQMYTVGTTLGATWDFGGIRQHLSPGVFADLVWPNLWRSYIEVGHTTRGLSNSMTRGGPLMGTPSSVNVSTSLWGSSVPRTQWYANANTFIDELGGWSASVDGGVSWLPGERLRLSVSPGLTRSRGLRQYYGTLEGGSAATYGRRYVFSALDQTQLYLQLRGRFTFTPGLSLELYGEPFAANAQFRDFGELPAAGSFDLRSYGSDGTTITRRTDKELDVTDGADAFTLWDADFRIRSFRSNAVLRWEWRRGSTFHLIWQQNRWMYDEQFAPVVPASLWRTIGDHGENIIMAKLSYWLAF